MIDENEIDDQVSLMFLVVILVVEGKAALRKTVEKKYENGTTSLKNVFA